MRHALLLLFGSIVLCLNGCGGQARGPAPTVAIPAVIIAPVVVCPAPVVPVLPAIDAALPLGHVDNVDALLERDDLLRQYIAGLRDCVNCYEAQAGNQTR